MFLLGVGVLWAGYTITWWGWLAIQGRVGSGAWPSFSNLVVPGRTPSGLTPASTAAGPPSAAGAPPPNLATLSAGKSAFGVG